MRDRETIDSELRRIALRRRSIREQGGQPFSREADELLDELLAHGSGASGTDAAKAGDTDVVADTRSTANNTGTTPRRRKPVPRRLGLFAALPLSLVGVAAAAVVVTSAVHKSQPEAQPAVAPPPPSARPSPATPKAPDPLPNMADAMLIAALKKEGVPVPSQEYVTTQGHAVCDFLAHQANFTDAVGFVQRSTVWDAKQSADFTAGAIVSYCPQNEPTGADELQPGFQNALSDLQAIQGDLQGIQGDLQGIPDHLPIPGG